MRFKEYFHGEKGAVCIGILLLVTGNLIGWGIFLCGILQKEDKGAYYLERREYGQGGYEKEIYVREEERSERDKIRIYVEEKKYGKEEAKKLFEEAKKQLDKEMNGKNKEVFQIRESLTFPDSLKDLPVQLSWSTDKPEVLDWEGNIGKKAAETGTEVTILCQMYLGEEEDYWERKAKVFLPEKNRKEILNEKIQDTVNQESLSSDTLVQLPKEIEGTRLFYSVEKGKEGIWVAFFTTVVGLLLPFLYREKKKEQEEKRRAQMQLDYPDIVSKLLLFLKAGLTLNGAIEKMVKDYRSICGKYGGGRRYAYEELFLVHKEIEGGMPEAKAYERLGKRCGIPEYKMLSVLLTQNLKKGNQGIILHLEREAAVSMEERKRIAKIRGEQASIKLLMPMLLQLLVVLAVLMVPAFLSFYL